MPPCCKELVTFDCPSIERKLGYFGNEWFVIFSFHPMAAEVIWTDGRISGFGGGGWQMFLDVFVRMAERLGAHLSAFSAACNLASFAKVNREIGNSAGSPLIH